MVTVGKTEFFFVGHHFFHNSEFATVSGFSGWGVDPKSTYGSKTPRGQWLCWLLACPRRPQGSHDNQHDVLGGWGGLG